MKNFRLTLTTEMMPGPSPEAKLLQLEQQHALGTYYDAIARATQGEAGQVDAAAVALARNQRTVDDLVALLGPDVPCYYVDARLAEEYSDAYKAVYGFRPGQSQRKEVLEFMAWLSAQPDNLALV